MHLFGERIIKISRTNPPIITASLKRELSSFDLTFRRISNLSSDLWPVGLECAIQRKIREDRLPIRSLRSTTMEMGLVYRPRIDFDLACRPPSELAGYYLWDMTRKRDLDLRAIKACNAILGGTGEFRSKPILTSRFQSGHQIMFDCSDDAINFLESWIHQFKKATAPSEVIERAIYLFFDFLVGHPFTDGNGRTARVLMQLFFHNNVGMQGPFLPIGPILIDNEMAFLDSILAWELFNEPVPFYMFMFKALKETRNYSRSILAEFTGN